MNKHTRSAVPWVLWVLAAWMAYFPLSALSAADALSPEQIHTVTPQDGMVIKDDQLDHSNPEQIPAESVQIFANGDLQLVSKPFIPPSQWKFLLFMGTATHVDIAFNPEGFQPDRLKDSDTEIKVQISFHTPVTAANFLLRCEGNMEPPPGGAVTVPHYFGAQVTPSEDKTPRVIAITATIPPTKPLTSNRNVGKDLSGNIMRQDNDPQAYESSETKGDWTKEHSLVLIRDSAKSIPLHATVAGEKATVGWVVRRNPTDNAILSNGNDPAFPKGELSLTKKSGEDNDLALDKTGDFEVIAFIDNKPPNGTFDVGEKYVQLNVVVVVLRLDANSKLVPTANSTNITGNGQNTIKVPILNHNFIPHLENPTVNRMIIDGVDVIDHYQVPNAFHMADFIPIKTGSFDLKNPNLSAMHFTNQVELYGGGPIGLDGLDRVHTGWANNLLNGDTFTATYESGKTVSAFQGDDQDMKAIMLEKIIFFTKKLPKKMDAPVNAAHPLLDAAPFADTKPRVPISSGDTILLPGQEQNQQAKPANGIGQLRITHAVDSPGMPVLRFHPSGFNNDPVTFDRLKKYVSNYQFKAHLIAWTGAKGAPTASKADYGNALYSVVASQGWSIDLSYTTENKVTQDDDGQPILEITPSDKNAVKMDEKGEIIPATGRSVPAQGLMEVAKPSTLMRSSDLDATGKEK